MRLNDDLLNLFQEFSALLSNTVVGPCRGPHCGFLAFWLHIAIKPIALFHHGVSDYVF